MIVVDRETQFPNVGKRRPSIRRIEAAAPFVDHEGIS